MKFTILPFLAVSFMPVHAQVKIGDNPTNINSNSLLELESTNKGVVLPRVSLTDINLTAPLSSTLLDGTLVFNTNASVIGGAGVGIYLWKSLQWRFLVTQTANTAWLLNGNNLSGSEFLGSTNAQPLNFKYNSTAAGLLDGNGNAAFGAGYTITGLNNTAIGGLAAATNTATAVGYGAIADAVDATALGINAKARAGNATAIGYNATTSQSNALVLGDASTVNVGIGTSTPNTDAKLDVAGNFKLGNPGSVLSNILKRAVAVPSFIILANTTTTTTVTFNGASTNGSVIINPRSALPLSIAIGYSYVSSANTITIGFVNSGALGLSLGNITFDITVIQ